MPSNVASRLAGVGSRQAGPARQCDSHRQLLSEDHVDEPSGSPPHARAAPGPGPGHLRRRLRIRARAPRLPAGRCVRARSRAGASGSGEAAASRLRARRLRRRRGADLLRASREAARHRPRGGSGAHQSCCAGDREGSRGRERRVRRRQHLQHQRVRPRRSVLARGRSRDVRGAGRLGRGRGCRLHHRRDVLVRRRRR